MAATENTLTPAPAPAAASRPAHTTRTSSTSRRPDVKKAAWPAPNRPVSQPLLSGLQVSTPSPYFCVLGSNPSDAVIVV
ncbi:hypothetical protein ACFVFJ_48235 [Streptomyces sp. NPDC057717]|uniref:hypothetical protein n=1 Tax=Streptomyces sp. NPDC057717 TaxID=3346224 RepID=UPI003687DF04